MPHTGPIDRTIVHYALNDPHAVRGGVETFALTLGRIFSEVLTMTPATRDERLVRERRLPVVCDNQWVLDWPEGIPVIGFQHGVAREKFAAIGGRETRDLARRQALAAARPNTLWVACARWISDAFAALHGNRAHTVVYHPVDVERFDGRLDNQGSKLVLHDGRIPHKGSRIYPWLAPACPGFRFEPLDVTRDEMPDRLRRAAAFLHLSSYEGNSVMCTEAMAMDLPCFFTRVGLLRDGLPLDVWSAPRELAFGGLSRFRRAGLVAEVGRFLSSLESRRYRPRGWVLEHATIDRAQQSWVEVMRAFDAMPFR